jgi:uncharacterized protein
MNPRTRSALERKRAGKPPELRRMVARFRRDQDITADGTFSGYGSVWGVVDSYGDIVVPGAFQASLEAHALADDMPKLLWQHLPEEPIGPWFEMREDDKGLWAKGQMLQEVQRGREGLALMRCGALSGLSIGYEAVDQVNMSAEEVRQTYGYEVPAGGTYRVLLEIDLWEVSVVTFPALAVAQVDSVKRPMRQSSTGNWQPNRNPPARREQASPVSLDIDALAAAVEKRGRLLSRLL